MSHKILKRNTKNTKNTKKYKNKYTLKRVGGVKGVVSSLYPLPSATTLPPPSSNFYIYYNRLNYDFTNLEDIRTEINIIKTLSQTLKIDILLGLNYIRLNEQAQNIFNHLTNLRFNNLRPFSKTKNEDYFVLYNIAEEQVYNMVLALVDIMERRMERRMQGNNSKK